MSVSGPAGLAIRRFWILADRSKVELQCGVDPGEGDGARPLFYCFASPTDGQKIGFKGHSTSAVAEQLLKRLPAPEDVATVIKINGPQFFGLHNPSIFR